METTGPGQRSSSRPRGAAVLTTLALWACATPLPPPDRPGAADVYRGELSRGVKGDRARQLRERLELAELESAKRAHTVLAYRKFLSEFPAGPGAAEARLRLEALRWADAESAGTEAAVSGFLADEPSGEHAPQAWALLARLRLEAALSAPGEVGLRAWLAAFPQAGGRDRALAALEEAQAAAARAAPESARAEALRAYLVEHPDGRHRAEVQDLLSGSDVAEAALLEDEAALNQLAREGVRGAQRVSARLRFERAAARLDAVALAELAGEGGPTSDEARTLVERLLGRERAVAAARRLYLPQPTADELPDDAGERARALRSWANALDGRRLGPLLGELRSRHAFVSLAAARAAQALLAGLPQPEARARALRLIEALQPKAQSSALLVELSLLEEAAGRPREALVQARAAVARELTPVAAWRAAEIEARVGEPPVALLAAAALLTQARSLGELHADVARPREGRGPDPVALLELCAASRAARDAERVLHLERLSAEPDAAALRARASAGSAAVGARLAEAERATGAASGLSSRCARLEEQDEADAEAAVAQRREAASLLIAEGPTAAAALERARRRDPDPGVQRALAGNPGGAEPARAQAAAPALE